MHQLIVLNKLNSMRFYSNLNFRIDKSNLKTTHRTQYCQHALYCIAVDDRYIAQTFRL